MKLGGKESYRSTRFVHGPRALAAEIWNAAWIGVKVHFRYTAWLVADIVATPAWLALFITPVLLFLPREQWGDPTVLNTFFWAMVLWDVIGAGLWSFGMAIRREQQIGTLEFLMLTNASRVVVFSRNLFTRLLSLAMGAVYMYVFFTLLFGANIMLNDILGVILTLLVGLFSAMGFGLLYGALVFRYKNVGPLTNILQFVLIGLCGIFYPVTVLPEQLRPLSYTLPFTYVSDLLRHHAMGTPTIMPVHVEWTVLLLYTLALLAAGFAIIKMVERSLKKKGLLGAY